MNSNVSWMLELIVQTGREGDFQALLAEMVAASKANEEGTLTYECSTSEDRKQCHIFERYADSAAALIHLGTFGEKFAGRFMEVFKPVRFVVYGTPSEAIRDALAAFNPVFMKPVAGFNR